MERAILVLFAVHLINVGGFFEETSPEEKRIDVLEAKLDALQRQMNECNCGVRPAFMAGLSDTLDHCTKGQHVIFDSVKVNVANGYNNKHGVFRAPVAGAYEFTVSLSLPSGYFQVELVKNNASNPIGYLYESSNQWEKKSTSVLTHLDVGDEVWLVCIRESTIAGNIGHVWGSAGDFHSHISGFLV